MTAPRLRTAGRAARVHVAVAGLMLIGLLAGGGCSRSQEALQADMDAFVAERDSCAMTADCTIAAGGCPLGCGFAVNVDDVDEVEAHADQLIAEYEMWGMSCAYDCIAVEAVCEDGTCERRELPAPG